MTPCPEVCSVHDIIMKHTDELFTKLSGEIGEIRTDLKTDIGAIRDDIRTLSDLIAGLSLLRLNQDNLRKDIDCVWGDVKEIKGKVSEIVLEKERVVTAAKLEHSRLKKDVDSAHTLIRTITEAREVESREVREFMVEMKSGLRTSLYFAGGIPTVCLFIYWLITKLYHVG